MAERWDERAILERLSWFVEIRASMDAVERVAYPASALPDPFTHSDPDLTRVEIGMLE